MFKTLFNLANKLDKLGFYAEADQVDELLKQEAGMDPEEYEKYYCREMDDERFNEWKIIQIMNQLRKVRKNPKLEKRNGDKKTKIVSTLRKGNAKKIDPQYKLACMLRSRLAGAISDNYKAGSAVEDLGCSIEELKQYLEKQFYTNKETGEMMS